MNDFRNKIEAYANELREERLRWESIAAQEAGRGARTESRASLLLASQSSQHAHALEFMLKEEPAGSRDRTGTCSRCSKIRNGYCSLRCADRARTEAVVNAAVQRGDEG